MHNKNILYKAENKILSFDAMSELYIKKIKKIKVKMHNRSATMRGHVWLRTSPIYLQSPAQDQPSPG